MKVCRAMLVLSVMVVLLGGFSCCPKQAPCPEIEVEPEAKKSMYVVITPCEDPDKCVVLPYERHMGTDGIKYVTFVNLTKSTVTIAFDNPDAIGNVDEHLIQPEQAQTFKLKNPQAPGGGLENVHEYSIKADCYEGPPAGPKIIIP